MVGTFVRALTLLLAASVLALLGGSIVTAWEVYSSDYLYYGQSGLVLWVFAKRCSTSLAITVSLGLLLLVLRKLCATLSRDKATADRAFFASTSAVLAAVQTASWGYHVNRYSLKGYWAGVRDVLLTPERDFSFSLLSEELIVTNLGILLAGIATGIALYFLAQFLTPKAVAVLGPGPGRRLWAVGAVSLILIVVCSAVEGRPRNAGQPNILLISIDTLRADHLGCYGYPRGTSPHIDSLAQRGVVFTNTTAQANWTLPSHMSLMTSQAPAVHGVQTTGQKLARAKTTVAEVLKNAGYRTIGITGGYNVDERFGFAQGFDDYHADKLEHLTSEEKIRYGQGVRLADTLPHILETLRAKDDAPLFLFVHAWDTHAPYMPHEDLIGDYSQDYRGDLEMITHEYIAAVNRGERAVSAEDADRIRALYDNEIRYVDRFLGTIFDELDKRQLRDNTIVALTSDHGDELMEHGLLNHGVALYQPEVHVPLIITYEGTLPAGLRVDSITRSIDIAPTILELAGVDYSAEVALEFQGRSLVNSWNRKMRPVSAVTEGRGPGERSLRAGKYKYIRGPESRGSQKDELYNLDEDPGELVDLSDAEAEIARHLNQQLSVLFETFSGIRTFGMRQKVESDEQFKKKLRALGYLQ